MTEKEPTIVADLQQIEKLKKKYPGVDIEKTLEPFFKIYNKHPFRERNRIIWMNKIKESITLINTEVKQIISDEDSTIEKFIRNFFTKTDLSKQILEIQPMYYDKNKLWWAWDREEFRWKIIDETDILNFVRELSFANTISSKEKA